jgi:hypothetical protein
VDEIVQRDKGPNSEKTDEPKTKEPIKPAFELEIPSTLSSSQKETAAGWAEDVSVIATEAAIPAEEAQVIWTPRSTWRSRSCHRTARSRILPISKSA